jgi:hypothetical protein
MLGPRKLPAILSGNPKSKAPSWALPPARGDGGSTMSDDVRFTEPVLTEWSDDGNAIRSANGQQIDWSGWEKWLAGHLAIEREAILDTIVEAVGDLEGQRDRQLRDLELKLAEVTGALGVLRRAGGGLRVCSTYDGEGRYEQHDIVMLNGSSFIATRDNPGQCPGAGWRLLCSAGRRGERGPVGPRGERGERGENAEAGSGFLAIHLDRATYTILLSTQDGKIHELNLRGLFEQFVSDMRGNL